MKKTILVTTIAIMLAAVPAMAQMMGSGQQMMEQQQVQQTDPATGGQNYPQHMNPGMMGGYGYGPGMMGGAYGMGPGMMGGGYGYGPGMMGGGYGYGPGMMAGAYGYGMHHGMMSGYGCGMGPGMMGYYSPEQYEKQFKKNQKFLDETQGLRKKLHTLKFDFAEARRNPATKPEDLEIMNTEMESIWKQIDEKRKSVFK
jgi:hypothetical protein